MPLIKSKSKEAREKNIATEVKAGRDPKQAVAIAYSTQRHAGRSKDMREPLPREESSSPGKKDTMLRDKRERDRMGHERDEMLRGRSGNQPAGGPYTAPQLMGDPHDPKSGAGSGGNIPPNAGKPMDGREPQIMGNPHDPKNGAHDESIVQSGVQPNPGRGHELMGDPHDPKSGDHDGYDDDDESHEHGGAGLAMGQSGYPRDASIESAPAGMRRMQLLGGGPHEPNHPSMGMGQGSSNMDRSIAGEAHGFTHSKDAWDSLAKSLESKRDVRGVHPLMGQSGRKQPGGYGGQGVP